MLRLLTFALFTLALAVPHFTRADDDDAPETALEAKALKLNSLTTTEAMNKRLQEINKDKVAAKKLVDAAVKLQKAGGEKSPFKYNAALVLGKVAQNVRDNKAAETFYDVCFETSVKLQSEEKVLMVFDSYVDVLWTNKKYDKAEEAIKKTLDLGGKNIEELQAEFAIKLAMTKAKMKDADEAIRIIDSLVNLDATGFQFLRIKAVIYSELGKNADAVATMEEVVNKASKQRNVNKERRDAQVRLLEYILTSFYVDNKQIDKAATILEKLIEAEPERATYYNDLGFIWCDNDMKLAESEKLIRKALKLDEAERKKSFDDGDITEEESEKVNSSYLDSLGWVLYKQGKYDEAYKYLLKASKDENEGAHLEIWDHLADCLVKLGKKEEAVKTWTEALTFDDASRRDEARRKKIEAKLKALKSELKK